MDKVWSDSKQKGSALLLLLAIADHASDDGYCWPKTDTLADKIRMDVRTVYRLTKQIEKDGELYVVRANRNNRYVVTIGMGQDELLAVLRARKEHIEIRDNLSPDGKGDKLLRDTDVTSIGDIDVTPGVTQLCHPNRHEPSLNRQEDDAFFPAPTPRGEKSNGDREKPITEYDSWLGMAAEVDRRRGGAPDWAMRSEGIHPYYPALMAFCKLTQRAPPVTEDQGEDWLDTLSDTALFLGIKADQLAKAIAAMSGDRFQWHLSRGIWSSPHSKSFQEKLDQIVGEMRAGTLETADVIRVGR